MFVLSWSKKNMSVCLSKSRTLSIPIDEWMNEWMKSYIAHVSSRRLFRALYIESNLARPVIIQIPTQSPGRYTAELPLRRIKLFFIPSEFALCAKYSHIVDFLGSRWMETAPTSIEVLLRPTLGQSDEPSDLRGSLSPTSVYSTWQSPGGHPSNYEPGATSPNFSDRANHDERTPYRSEWDRFFSKNNRRLIIYFSVNKL